ncbi:MAG: ribose-phosphate pyrophosphokinase [Bacillota bacterium]
MIGELKIFSGQATRQLTEKVCHHLNQPLGQMEAFRFSNDNFFVRIQENVREADVFVIQTSVPPVDANLMETLITIDALRRASAARVSAVLPYYPYARSDKKDQPRIPITARLVADLLTAAGADRVITFDLHADQIQGFFSIPLDHLSALPLLTDYFAAQQIPDLVVVALDTGGVKRATEAARRLDTDVAMMDKRRIGNQQRVTIKNIIGEVAGRPVLIFEDEIQTGGSLLAAGELLRARGATDIYVACLHPAFTKDAAGMLSSFRFKEIVVTDTVPLPPRTDFPGLSVVSVAPLLAEAIRRTHHGESISTLFS